MRRFWLAVMLVTAWTGSVFSFQDDDSDGMTAATFRAFELRGLGPALMSGRIADIAFVPDDPATWYVGVGSGGVWKTENAGTSWTPIFDDQSVYSIGTVALDPSNANVVWVGTGENVSGRHVGFGDGIYVSRNGGKSWEKKGLEASEHISEIIVHPEDSNTLWVASQGPLWSKGGERGLFKSTDGGESWRNTLSAGPWTGVTALVIDPRDPDVLYAATWQHHRTVAALIDGGPETAIYKSEDGGENWRKLSVGLPTGNMGKIGLAISPVNPDILYAAIELDQRTGGTWRSADRGESWTKMSDEVSGGTGPHYYQEIYASPHKLDRVYLTSNLSKVSDDGGKTWRTLNQKNKHVDDHAMAFHPTDPDYLLVGSDGGLYETHDGEKSWRFINNLPVTQFYKVAADDAEPFYFVYGGTQDNSTQGGPSRTDNRHGIRNSDWFLTIFADGHQPATEPGNPDIVYSSWQQGNLVRHDRKTGEVVYIQPQPKPGEPAERFNWDAPIFVSQHDPKRLYHASQRVWRSDDRGDSWQPISGDLTRNQDRMLLPLMDRQWSAEAPWDLLAMSNFNTITSLGESPVDENTLYAGTDDGLIQISRDGGESWRQVEAGSLPGVPDRAFINDIRADLFDANTVYVALDNHKEGDYKPYLLKSTDGGRRWQSMTGNLPEKTLVWRIVQDHENPNLFFLGTEFGLYFTVDAGENWVKLEGGAPTISFRDVIIQRRENDVVAGSFGRGIFILDDYSPLRSVTADDLDKPMLFGGRDAHWYIERSVLSFGDPGASQGAGFFRAENPPFGAVFSYYLPESLKSLKDERVTAEKPLIKEGDDTPFPGFDRMEQERRETPPEVWLTVRAENGRVVRRIKGATDKGFHRASWDLRMPSPSPIEGSGGGLGLDSGFLVPPGTYTVDLTSRVRGATTVLVEPTSFNVVPLHGDRGALASAGSFEEVAAFWDRLADILRATGGASGKVKELDARLGAIKAALGQSESAPAELDDQWQALRTELFQLEEALGGQKAREGYGAEPKSVQARISTVVLGTGLSTYGPTPTHLEQLGYAEAEFADIRTALNTLAAEKIPALEAAVAAADAPWTSGAAIPAVE